MAENAIIPGPSRRRNDKGRRCWSTREEQVLLAGLKEIITQGWKSDNGFRVGYLQALEAHMGKEFPGTDLKATPHINSKIHGWKKSYGSLFSMLSKSGIGWNATTKMIEAEDDAWEQYLKVDNNAKIMRYKSWPYYEDWCDIFGRDRATGAAAEGFADAVNGVLQELDPNGSNFVDKGKAPATTEGVTDEISFSMGTLPPAQSEAVTKKVSGKKRKSTDASDDPLCEILGSFCERADARLGEISKRIGHEQDMVAARKEVWAVVEPLDHLTLKEKLKGARSICQSVEDLVLFFTLPPAAREEFDMMKLDGNF